MNHVQNAIPHDKCCGCTACMAVCTHNAIKMGQDDEGFLYPAVDETLCKDCGLCTKVCPSNDTKLIKLENCYAVKRTDREKLMTSTSGGFAAALSEQIINEGGVVYGVAYSEFPYVATIRVDNLTDAEKLKGSKYVQTDLQNTFREAAEDLKAGKKVLFTGTSCHINGLLNFLLLKRIDTTNLVTIDLVCHGVPSSKLFEEYIAYASKGRRKVVDYRHRTIAHRTGWGAGSVGYCPTILWDNSHTSINTPLSRAYMILFFSNNCLRPHCHQCPYAGKGRVADYTIADYWGLKDAHSEFFTKEGVSLVFVNTEKAGKMFGKINGIEAIPSTFEQAARKQANLYAPSPVNPNKAQFWKEYHQKGISYVLKKYCGVSNKDVLKWHIKQMLTKIKLLKK